MGCSMVFKNISILIKRQPMLFTLFSLLQILSIITVIYLYSDVRSQRIELEQYKGTTSTFELIYEDGVYFSDIKSDIEKLKQNQTAVSNITFLLDKENNIIADYSYNSSQVDLGQPLKESEDILLGELYATNNNINIGDEIEFLNRKFKVVGLFLPISIEAENKQILFSSIYNDDTIYQMQIKLRDIPTKREKENFTEFLYNTFDEANIIVPEERNYIDEYKFDSQLLISFSVVILVFFNISFIYNHILMKRRINFAIYGICGCKRIRIISILFLEVLCYFVVHMIISILLWLCFIKKFLIDESIYLSLIDIFIPIMVYFVFSFAVFGVSMMNYSKQRILELLYFEKKW